jgi:chromosome partitioning protein
MAKIICLAQSKGGTSKTSSTLNVSACLLQKGYRVLTCDLDQQASLTISLGTDPLKHPLNMYSLLTDAGVTAEDVIVKTEEGIDLIPADLDLSVVELNLKETIGRERLLKKKLSSVAGDYDFILIDTPPSFALTTFNGMAAADYLLVPVQPEPLCLYGLRRLTENLKLIQENSNPTLRMLGVFITLYDSRLGGHKEIADQIREGWGKQAFKTVIRRRSNILQATVEARSVITMQENSDLAHDYKALTEEVLIRVQA